MSASRKVSKPAPDATSQRAWLMSEYDHLDPITFQVIASNLISACREMGITMIRTAYSPIFVDGLDFSCGILDPYGEMIAQGEFCPVHLNSMAYSAQWALMERGVETLRAGDVLIHNDPYRGGTHLNDFNVIKPIFVDGVLVAIACNRAHQIDMGGKARAGFAGDATEVFQEGIRVPPIKWFAEGQEITDASSFLLANVRQPTVQRGDLAAQLASCVVAERRIIEICRRYGTDVVMDCFEALKDYSERRVRSSIRKLPAGTWSFEDWMDHDGVDLVPVRIAVTLTIRDDDLTVDFSQSNAQVRGPINATYGITASMVFTALLHFCEPDIPVNHGAFRPVTINAPRGSITNAQFPSPTMGGNTVTSMTIFQTVMGAFAKAVPESAVACSYNSHHFTGGGRNASGDWLFYFFTDGGWGAIDGTDGWSGVFQVNGNCKDYPAEVIEATLPLRYEAIRLRGDLAGPGKHRGGSGTERVITFLEEAEINSIADRHDFRPYGLNGGEPAGNNSITIARNGRALTLPEITAARSPLKFSNQPVESGDTVSIVTTGGGGFGDPLERDPGQVLVDVRDELLTIEQARDIYGVIIKRTEDGDGGLAVTGDTLPERAARLAARRPRSTSHSISSPPALKPFAKVTPIASEVTQRVNELLSRRPDSFCSNHCELAASPHKCPMWNREAINYWAFDNLGRWLQTHCPESESFAATINSARVY